MRLSRASHYVMRRATSQQMVSFLAMGSFIVLAAMSPDTALAVVVKLQFLRGRNGNSWQSLGLEPSALLSPATRRIEDPLIKSQLVFDPLDPHQ